MRQRRRRQRRRRRRRRRRRSGRPAGGPVRSQMSSATSRWASRARIRAACSSAAGTGWFGSWAACSCSATPHLPVNRLLMREAAVGRLRPRQPARGPLRLAWTPGVPTEPTRAGERGQRRSGRAGPAQSRSAGGCGAAWRAATPAARHADASGWQPASSCNGALPPLRLTRGAKPLSGPMGAPVHHPQPGATPRRRARRPLCRPIAKGRQVPCKAGHGRPVAAALRAAGCESDGCPALGRAAGRRSVGGAACISRRAACRRSGRSIECTRLFAGAFRRLPCTAMTGPPCRPDVGGQGGPGWGGLTLQQLSLNKFWSKRKAGLLQR